MSRPLNIIYVESEPELCHEFKTGIGRNIRNKITCLRGFHALKVFLEYGGEGRPGIVLVNLMIDGSVDGGKQCVEYIRKNHADLELVPLLIVLGTNNSEQIRQAQLSGADAYIVKPITMDSFMYVLRTLGSYDLEIVKGESF